MWGAPTFSLHPPVVLAGGSQVIRVQRIAKGRAEPLTKQQTVRWVLPSPRFPAVRRETTTLPASPGG